jgi:conjugative relaxase-like TrwC/TraI family protein
MLRVRPIHHGASGAVVKYLTEYLTEAIGEPAGQWAGHQAPALGLPAEVDAAHLQAILDGTHPLTGVTLGAPFTTRERANGKKVSSVIGFDATFSAPKTLSIMWALSDDDGFAECHDIAVQAAIGAIEQRAATTRVRSNGSRMFLDTEGITAAVFRQSTSRADDPQLHSHVVISSKVQTSDGRWRALDARQLMDQQSTFGRVYQAALRAEVTNRYGLVWTDVVKGQAEIAGVPIELIELFSKRAEEIDAELARRLAEYRKKNGHDAPLDKRSAIEREVAADTRAAKTGISPEDLRSRWAAEAASIGIDYQQLVSLVSNAVRAHHETTGLPSVDDLLAAIAEHRSTWQHLDVIRHLTDTITAPRSIGGRQWADAIGQLADQAIEASINIDAPTDSPLRRTGDGRSVWSDPTTTHATSEHVLIQEEHIATWAIDAQATPSKPSTTVEAGSLDTGQHEAASAIAGHDRLVLVVGPAGAGKTTMLHAATIDLERQQRPVFGFAPTAKAARVLETETGMRSDTVAKLLYDLRHRPAAFEPPATGTTIVIDEAGMLNTADLHQLINHTDTHDWRLALVGDPHQLHAVGRGGMFDELCATGLTIELDQLHRFTHNWEAAATLQLRKGDPSVLNTYAEHKAIIAGTFDEHLAGVVNEWRWHQTMNTTLAITTTRNDDVHTINNAIQADRLQRNDLDAAAAAPLSIGVGYSGDVITTRRNDRRLITSTGDTVRNRDRWTINTIHSDGVLEVASLDGERTVTLPADYVTEHVHLGYAATEHGAQGETADASLTIVTDATTNRGLYVGATRGRNTNLILTVADDRDHALQRLTHIITNDRTDLPATVQRRHLLNDQKQLRPPRTPRCEIPDWFDDVHAEARTEAHKLRSQAESKKDARAQRESAATEAQSRLPAAEAAHEPFARDVAASKQRVTAAENAKRSAWWALERSGRLGRRSAAKRLKEMAATLAIANDQLDETVEQARPTQDRIDNLNRTVDDYRDRESTHHTLNGWYNYDGQAARAEDRLAAIEAWRRWADGQDIGQSDLGHLSQAIPFANSQLAALLHGSLEAYTSIEPTQVERQRSGPELPAGI